MQLLLMSLTAMLAATDGTRADTLPHLFLSSFSHLSSSRRASFTHPSHKQPYTHRSSTHKYAHRSSLHKTSYAHMSSSSLPQPVPLVMKTARFVVVSEGRYDHAHHTHGWEDHESREPHFAGGNTSTEVYLGNTVTLDCTVHDMLNESVSIRVLAI
ncbi:uncharacterized protein [Procambarus clarkii]|uniref:uncharacterized protein n=1 Tax=Procambarus clarkii TaxID=6728 RepID=UPI00374279DE